MGAHAEARKAQHTAPAQAPRGSPGTALLGAPTSKAAASGPLSEVLIDLQLLFLELIRQQG